MPLSFSRIVAALKPKRRWFQYSLRTLLLVVLLAGFGLGLLGRKLQQGRKQHKAVMSLEERGGYVDYDFQYPTGSYDVNGFDPLAVSRVPRWLLDLVGVDFFHNVVAVRVRRSYGYSKRNPDADDALLRRLDAFPKLRRLDLSHCGITDEGLQDLGDLTALETLDLSHTSVTDDGLPHLGKLKSLKRLELSHNRVGGRGFHRLTALRHLEVLHLSYAPVGDEALKTLNAIPGLSYVSVYGCLRLTPEGVAAFQQAMPKCRLGGLPSLKLYWESSMPRPGPDGHPVKRAEALGRTQD